jgi:hypothetical protein
VVVSASELNCTLDTVCTARGCDAPSVSLTFGLRIDGAATVAFHGRDPSDAVTLPPYPGPTPARMRVFSGPDGNGMVMLSLRHDGGVTLTLHAGRMVGPFANESALSMGRCEVPA